MKSPGKPDSSEITPERVYFNRRAFMRGGLLAGSAAATAYLYRKLNAPSTTKVVTQKLETLIPGTGPDSAPAPSPFSTDEPMNSYNDITHYNNFYEFSTDKDEVAQVASGFKTDGWKVEVTGLCSNPKTFDLDDILKIAPAEERIYRHRCVEAWSMVIPWAGYSLSKLLQRVAPLSSAKFVAMESFLDPERMPGLRSTDLNWPYTEGLRMDEAMHPLTLLTSGLYGRTLPPQDGAPIRLIIPWKYGFKGIKSIIKIALVANQPQTIWNAYAASEYGFYANVNPEVDHPRWSQATERRIGEFGRRNTLLFNGYGDQVASLYAGMDLRTFF